MNKQVIGKKESQERLLRGINLLGDTVGETLGPGGRTVIYQKTSDENGKPFITKDGVTVAMNVSSQDKVENIGIELVKDAARKSAILAGDGTTTSTILTQEILKKAFESDVVSPRDFVKGMEDASKDILEVIEKHSIELNEELLQHVATISANNNTALGERVAEAYKEAGEYGFVGFEVNKTGFEVEVDVRNGTVVNAPCMDPNFFTSQADRICEQEDPLIFISSAKLDTPRQLQAIFEYALENKRPLTIMADCEVGIYKMMAMNAQKNSYPLNAVKPVGVGVFLRETLEDLAAVTGATLHGEHLGDAVNTITPDMLGTCSKLTTTVNDTLLEFDGNRGPKTEELAKQVEAILAKEQSEGRRESLKKRLAALKGKFALIKVGASSSVELNEKYDLVEDAVKAVASAKEEGIVPGGGNMLRYAASTNKKSFEETHTDYEKGYSAVIHAAGRPFERILENADLSWESEDGEPFSSDTPNWGVDARSGDHVNLIESGIVDPTFVTKQAIENSVSVAKTIVTTSSTIVNL